MVRSSVAALTLSAFLCSSCATTELAEYPSNLWPALTAGGACGDISRSYEDMTEDIWPTAAMRGSKAKARRSLAEVLTAVSPSSRPENLPHVKHVEISVAKKQAKLFGAWDDFVSLSDWDCSEDGALVVSIKRDAQGEGSFDARVEIRFELRPAVDHSLIVHQFQQFSDLSIKQLLRETWYRFLPSDTP
jgi:hypothetical protein